MSGIKAKIKIGFTNKSTEEFVSEINPDAIKPTATIWWGTKEGGFLINMKNVNSITWKPIDEGVKKK